MLLGDRERQRAVSPAAEEHNLAAERYFRQALSIAEKGQVDPLRKAETLERLGDTALHLGRYEEKVAHYRLALQLKERVLGLEDPRLCSDLIALGNEDRVRGGLDWNTRCLDIRAKFYGERSPQVAESLVLIAAAYQFLGDLANAESALRQALDIRETDPSVHEDLLRQARILLAAVLEKRGKSAEAEALKKSAFDLP